MPVYSPSYLKSQIGRTIHIHYWPEYGRRGKKRIVAGRFEGTIGPYGQELAVRSYGLDEGIWKVPLDADQPAFARKCGDGMEVWWEWVSPQIRLPPGFVWD